MYNKQLYNSIIKNISKVLYKNLQLYEMARSSVNRTIDKKLWLSVSSTCSKNRSTEAEFIKPIGSDKNLLLQRYVAALLIMKKDCPETENDIDDLKTFKLVGKKYLELGGTLDEIQKLYNQNKYNGITTKQKENQQTNNDIAKSTNDNIINKQSSGGFFDDEFDDLTSTTDFDDFDDFSNDLARNSKLPYDYSLEYVLSKQLDMIKPRGFKFQKHDTSNKLYDCYYYSKYITSSYQYNFEKFLFNNNWQVYKNRRDVMYIERIPSVSNAKDATSEQLNEITEKYEKYTQVFNETSYKYIVVFYIISPDNGLIYIRFSKTNEEHNRYYGTASIFTFTGDVSYDFTYNNNDKKTVAKGLKEKNKKINKFYSFTKRYNGFGTGFRANYQNMLDEDGYPYIFITGTERYIKNQLYIFIKHPNFYKSTTLTIPDTFLEVISVNNNYLHLYGYYDNEHKYSNDAAALIIKLTEDGKKAYDNFYK